MCFVPKLYLNYFNHRPTLEEIIFANGEKAQFREESRRKLVEGINVVANAVKITIGPKAEMWCSSAPRGT